MPLFRGSLAALFIAIFAYTCVTITNHGMDFVSPFFQALVTLNWQGQFTADFLAFLLISGVWTAWRGGFSGTALSLALLAVMFGILFLTLYLLYLSYRPESDARQILLGDQWTAEGLRT